MKEKKAMVKGAQTIDHQTTDSKVNSIAEESRIQMRQGRLPNSVT
jgi:hypothetical protein